ncbi:MULTISPECIES: hypothetical protein [Nostoc]|uniref:Uncharacterized protein n=1 Tax=Nostoc paludosum FACHB-159 TaxID=2692908 RepID=A0ABR8KCD4_9NOSO|nr:MULTISPECIES: hypothetical protein [Nostoc]MBD2679700.1 hypothetical protein [Nostoc sp. FACHB-857]MBD2736690.1 hypothetical protein [Nostoc paludosum FACHB-159]
MNPFFNGVVRGLAGQAGRVVAGVVFAGVMGAFGIDNDGDFQADSQVDTEIDSQENSDSINEDTEV